MQSTRPLVLQRFGSLTFDDTAVTILALLALAVALVATGAAAAGAASGSLRPAVPIRPRASPTPSRMRISCFMASPRGAVETNRTTCHPGWGRGIGSHADRIILTREGSTREDNRRIGPVEM